MKIIITDCDHKDINIETEVLTQAGVAFELKQCRTEEAVIAECSEGDVFINQYAPITAKVMDALPNLKMVVRYGVGVDNIDVAAATERGVQVCNVPDYGMNEVADHAIALMMAMTRKIVIMNQYTRQEKWDYTHSMPIHRNSAQTVGVVGLGRIGRNFANKAHALGFQVIGYDPYYKESEESTFIRVVSLEELMAEADIISLHCPADGNRNLFDAAAFKRMKKTACIINVARGGIIDEAALCEALENGEIAGAALDCVTKEPMRPDAPLYRQNNCIVTPHMAWYSEEAAAELNRKVAEEAVCFAQGEPVRYPVNSIKKDTIK